jgi:hypothetical protein
MTPALVSSAETMAIQPETKLGHYDVLAVIGKGGMDI